MESNNQTADPGRLPRGLASFRTVAILVVGLVLVWVAMSVTEFMHTRQRLRELLHRQAEGMAATLALADQYLSQTLEHFNHEQALRLVTIGLWLRDVDAQGDLTVERLRRVADETDVFNVGVFDPEGRREFGLRGFGPFQGRGLMGRGRGLGRVETGERLGDFVREFLQSGETYSVRGVQIGGRRAGGPGPRGPLRMWRVLRRGDFSGVLLSSAMVRRTNGGAIAVLVDADEQEVLRQEMGPVALMEELVNRPGVAYLERRRAGETDLSFGAVPPRDALTGFVSLEGSDAFEVEIDVPGQEATTLIVGFDAEPLRTAERDLRRRLLLSASVAALLGTIGLLWARLRKHHGLLANTLKRIHSYHRALLERMDDAVIAWGDDDGLTFWNARAEKLFAGLSAGHPPPTSLVAVADVIRGVGGQTVLTFEEAGVGTRRFRTSCEVLEAPIRTNLLFLTDVTDVEQATGERHQREHLEALASVASGVAHEVRNPLNAIDMTIQTLCAEPSTLVEKDRKTLEDLRQEIARINGIVEHFLAYGRPQPPTFSEVDLSGILREVASFLSPVAEEKGVAIRIEASDEVVVVADTQQVRQAFLNVVLNALEASETGTTARLWLREGEDEVACGCQDQGVGMTPEQVEHLFDPYVTTKSGGAGLGMSIVQRIIRGHKGRISVESRPGQGTEVVLHFMRDPAQTL